MKVGDLAITHKGNLCVVLEIGKNIFGKIDWYNIVFCRTGVQRDGYPSIWLRSL